MSLIDRTGQVYTRLTVISRAAIQKGSKAEWLCRCSCGNFCVILGGNLATGHTKSCGCLHTESLAVANKNKIAKHGHSSCRNIGGKQFSHSPTYITWHGMRQRCNNPGKDSYHHYGGKGISYDPRWDDFKFFLADVGERPSLKHQLHRLNSNGNYEIGNVCWSISHKETDISQCCCNKAA